MRCPKCGTETTQPVCPSCGNRLQDPEVLEPEILSDIPSDTSSGGQYTVRHTEENYRQHNNGWTHVVWTSTSQAGNPFMTTSCMPSFITLALALFAWLEYGLLAAIGFLFFALIGRAFTLYASVKKILEGRITNPWIYHIITWVICWFLVAWLSGNLQ